MSERLFAVRLREVPSAVTAHLRKGEFFVSDEVAANILQYLSEDLQIHNRREAGRLVHPDD